MNYKTIYSLQEKRTQKRVNPAGEGLVKFNAGMKGGPIRCLIDTGSSLELVNKKEARIQKEEKIVPGESKVRKRELEEDWAVNETIRIKRSSPEEAEKDICHWEIEQGNSLHNMQEGI